MKKQNESLAINLSRDSIKFTICVDFDGTICEHRFPEIGEMKKHAKEVLTALHNAGCKIVIYSCRCNVELNPIEQSMYYINEMEKWLKENEIPYDEVWKGQGKPIAHVYIDDRGVPFTGWAQVLNLIIGLAKMGKPVTEQEDGKDEQNRKLLQDEGKQGTSEGRDSSA